MKVLTKLKQKFETAITGARENMSFKGQSVINTAIGIGIAIFLAAAVVIGIDSFQTSVSNSSTAYNVLSKTQTMFDNFAGQLGTVGTLLGVALIIGVVALFGTFLNRRASGGL